MAGWPAASASQALSGNRRSSSVVLGQPHLVGLSADFFCDQLEPQRPGHSVPKSCRPRRMVAGLQLSDDWLLDGTSLLDVAALPDRSGAGGGRQIGSSWCRGFANSCTCRRDGWAARCW
jgi:hypothetical protein